MKTLIQELVETFGPSGYEDAVRTLLSDRIGGAVDEVRTDALGNLIAHKKGSGQGLRVMLAAHMDEIGLVVSHIDQQGFARFQTVGGVWPITLVSGRVRFANGAAGVIGWEYWLQKSELPKMDELFIDLGATSAADAPVAVGDVACFDRPFQDLGKRLVAKAMDDRIACAIAVQTLRELQETPNDIYVVFSTQEEVGTRGAMTAAFGIAPDVAVAIDVTDTGDTPEAIPMAVSLGGGPAIKIKDSGMIAHAGVKDWMIRTAEQAGIPYQREVLTAGTTDAYSIQTTRAGVPAGCLSIPCRNIHTPSEIVDYDDVLNSVRLLRAMLSAPITL
ncbi:MAG: M42 family metallopeptidase [Anaerolineales bacterium]